MVESVPVLPLSELGSRLGCRTKGALKLPKRGAKRTINYQRGMHNLSKLLKRGANPMYEGVLKVIEVLKEKKGG